MYNYIFNRKYLNKELSKFDINVIPNITKHQETLSKWKNSIESKNLNRTKEASVQGLFLTQIFGDVLGYNNFIGSTEWNMIIEKKTQFDSTVVDASLGFYSNIKDDTKVVIELKDAKTELDRKQNRSNPQSPVEQAFSYQIKHKDCRWIIVSNIREIRLYNSHTITEYEKFIIENLTEETEFKRFIYLLHKDHLIAKGREQSIIDILYTNNDIEENQITNEFYKYYKNIRINLLRHLIQYNENKSQILLLEKTQKILDRLIFIRFCEDSKLLPNKLFKKVIDTANNSFSRSDEKIWSALKDLFDSIDKGNEQKNINRFNGGLFNTDIELNSLIIKDTIFEDIDKILNYDFESEVDVNLLGHIFEQSISDLEEIKADLRNEILDKKNSKRKQHGVFYTPQFITSFLVTRVIDDWLLEKRIELREDTLPILSEEDFIEYSKKLGYDKLKGKTKVEKHIDYYLKLQDSLRNIKILDPACGSGAFLNAAYDYLHVVGMEINRILENLSGTRNFFDLDNHILRHNLFGVDLNKESVEITKLSLWIKSANAYDPLTTLDNNIKFGNTIINDFKYDARAFQWETEFEEIIKSGGFDIILGNPPYIYSREKITDLEKEFYFKNYLSVQYQINTFPLFIEKSINLLKVNGKIGFIVPDTLLKLSALSSLRKLLLEEGYMDTIVQLYGKSFEDAGVETVAFIYNKGQYHHQTKTSCLYNSSNLNSEFIIVDNSSWKVDPEFRFQVNINSMSNNILDKLRKLSVNLEEKFDVRSGLKAYEAGKGIPNQTREDVQTRPYDFEYKFDKSTFKYLDGKDINPFYVNWDNKWLKYGENLAAPRTFEQFSEPRLLIREITSNFPRCFIATYTDEIFLNNLSLINVIHKEKNVEELKVLLALLSSELLSYYFNKTNPKSERKLFPKLILKDLKKFPIVIPEDKNELVNLVNTLIELHDNNHAVRNKFINRMQSRFEVSKISKNLNSFYELTYKDFLKELLKMKINLNLEQEDEWEQYFNKYKTTINQTNNNIENIIIKINEIVYSLYRITKEEIKFIKEDTRLK